MGDVSCGGLPNTAIPCGIKCRSPVELLLTKTKPSSSSLAGLALIVLAIGFAIYEFTAARQAEASLATANHEHQVDQARLQELANDARVAAQKQADLQKLVDEHQRVAAVAAPAPVSDEASQADKAAKAAAAARMAKATGLADGQAFLSSFGQSREMLVEIGKAQIGRNYAQFFRLAGLSPAQIDDLENQTAAHWLDTITVAPNSIHPGDPELPDDKLKTILGDQGFQQLQDYRRIQPLQGMVSDISSLATSAPLTPEQATQLLGILGNASDSYRGGGKANPQLIDWSQVLVQAQGVLSEAQLTALKAEAQLPQVMSLVKQFYQNQPTGK